MVGDDKQRRLRNHSPKKNSGCSESRPPGKALMATAAGVIGQVLGNRRPGRGFPGPGIVTGQTVSFEDLTSALVADPFGEVSGALPGDFDEMRIAGDLVEHRQNALRLR